MNALTNLAHHCPEGEHIAKTHGGASMTQSPCDTQHGHGILRSEIHSSDFKYGKRYSHPHGAGWEVIRNKLKACFAPQLFDIVWKAFCHLSPKIKKAFSTSNVQSGFNISGLVTYERMRLWESSMDREPYCCMHRIISVWPGFGKLNPEQANLVLQ